PRAEGLGTFSYKFDVRGGIPGLGAKAIAKNYSSLKFLSTVVPSFNYGISHSLPRSVPNLSLISPASGFSGVGASAGRIVEFNCGVGQGVGIAAAIAITQNRQLFSIQNREIQQVLAATGQLPILYGVGYQESQTFNAFERAMQPDKLAPGAGGGGSVPIGIDDVTGHWAAGFIQALRSRGTLQGYPDGSFRPDAGLTRAEFAAALVEAFDLPLRRSPKSFNDITTNFWGRAVITKAVQMGFLSGFPNSMFRPQAGLTRAQTWVALVSGLDLDATANLDITALYGDAQDIPPYARQKIITASDRLLVINHPERDRLNARRPITRGELAAILYQALLSRGEVPTLDHPSIVRPVEILNPARQDPPALDIIESAPPSQNIFSDVAGHWAQAPIECLVIEDILTELRPYEFAPDLPMTRLQFIQAIARAFTVEPQRPSIKFTDIPEVFWANGLIQQIYQGGFVEPLEDNQFQPN
ncbi:MAG: S-layer homology domain-containing protein, partial [Cyanobacteria bacterium P01_H01_bin.130]